MHVVSDEDGSSLMLCHQELLNGFFEHMFTNMRIEGRQRIILQATDEYLGQYG